MGWMSHPGAYVLGKKVQHVPSILMTEIGRRTWCPIYLTYAQFNILRNHQRCLKLKFYTINSLAFIFNGLIIYTLKGPNWIWRHHLMITFNLHEFMRRSISLLTMYFALYAAVHELTRDVVLKYSRGWRCVAVEGGTYNENVPHMLMEMCLTEVWSTMLT
jgi:hypothetical protein